MTVSKSPSGDIFSDVEEDIFFPPASSPDPENLERISSKASTGTAALPFRQSSNADTREATEADIRSGLSLSLEPTRRSPTPGPLLELVSYDAGQVRVCCMPADGDCMFRAALHQASDRWPSADDVMHLRRSVSEFIADNRATYRQYFSEEDLEKYIDAIKERHEWGGYESIVAITNIFGRRVEIYHEFGPMLQFEPSAACTGPPLKLAYRRCSVDEESTEVVYNHYDSVVDVEVLQEQPSSASNDDDDGGDESDCSCSRPVIPTSTPRHEGEETPLISEVSAIRRPASGLGNGNTRRDCGVSDSDAAVADSTGARGRGQWKDAEKRTCGRLSLKRRRVECNQDQRDSLPISPEVPCDLGTCETDITEGLRREVSTYVKTVHDIILMNEFSVKNCNFAASHIIHTGGTHTRTVATNVTVSSGKLVGTFQVVQG